MCNKKFSTATISILSATRKTPENKMKQN